MREIKFRAWNKSRNKWELRPEDRYRLFLDIATGRLEIGNGDENFVWEQFTGLKDRTGKYIYEGDIIRLYGENRVEEIFWANGQAMFQRRGEIRDEYDGARPLSALGLYGGVELIGNIHENPDLLKV